MWKEEVKLEDEMNVRGKGATNKVCLQNLRHPIPTRWCPFAADLSLA
jgi:hypothetical protein